MKKLSLIVFCFIITFTNISTGAERDCENPKGFHAKLMCKKASMGNTEIGNGTENKEKKSVKGFFKKPKFLKTYSEWHKRVTPSD